MQSCDIATEVEMESDVPVSPLAVARLADAFGEKLSMADVSAAELRWQETPDGVRVQRVCRASDGVVLAFLAERRGRWWSRHWSPPMGKIAGGILPKIGALLSPPEASSRLLGDETSPPAVDEVTEPAEASEEPAEPEISGTAADDSEDWSPADQIAAATIANAKAHSRDPQPLGFAGALEDALVFVPDGPIDDYSLRDRLWNTMRKLTAQQGPVEGVPGDGFAGSATRHPFGVAEWGPFPHAVPRARADQLLAIDGVTTVVMRSIDTHSAGPSDAYIAH